MHKLQTTYYCYSNLVHYTNYSTVVVYHSTIYFCQTTIICPLQYFLLQPHTQDVCPWAPCFCFMLTVNPSPEPNKTFSGTSMFCRVDGFRIETQFWGGCEMRTSCWKRNHQKRNPSHSTRNLTRSNS